MNRLDRHRSGLCIMGITLGVFGIVVMLAGCGGGGGGGGRNPVAPQSVVSGGTAGITGAAYTQITIHGEKGAETLRIPLSGAGVKCGDTIGKTDSEGRFTILGAKSGKTGCTISKAGYAAQTISFEVSPGGTFNAPAIILMPAESGAVKIISAEAAPVSFDGLESPPLTTGVTLSGVSAGSHEVAVVAGGFESAATQTVGVKAGATATVTLELVKKTVSIDITSDVGPVRVGETLALAANCGYADGSEGECTGKVTWDSSDRGVGIVTDKGVFTAVAAGETKVSATRLQSRITHPGVTVKVLCPENTSWMDGRCAGDTLVSVAVAPADIAIEEGGSVELAAVCTWRIAGAAPCPELAWKSSSPGTASVDADGTVTGAGAGNAVVTASSQAVTGNPVTIVVTETQYPDPSCQGAGGFCLDLSGTAGGGRAEINVTMSNPPAAGLGTGVITLSWEPGAMAYESVTADAGIVGIGEPDGDGRLVLVFTSPEPITADTVLFTAVFTAPQGAPVRVTTDQALKATNFTDFGLNLISQSGIVFRDGYAGR